MRVKDIIQEDFCNYKEPAMFIVSAVCDWKCCKEQGLDISVCQNEPLVSQPTKDIEGRAILDAFRSNPISKAVVIGGLEPFLQFGELKHLIATFRENGETAPFVIYTGYYKDEISDEIGELTTFGNIIVKFGRYIPNQKPHFDKVLGVMLASDNQYAEVIC